MRRPDTAAHQRPHVAGSVGRVDVQSGLGADEVAEELVRAHPGVFGGEDVEEAAVSGHEVAQYAVRCGENGLFGEEVRDGG